jgi:hypothetical protein
MAKRAKTKKRRKTRAVTAKKRRKTQSVASKKRRKTRPVARKKKTDEPRFVTDAEAARLKHAQPSKSYVLAEEGTKPLVPEDKDS